MIKINAKTSINPSEVLWVEGHVNYSKLIMTNQKPILVAVTLKKIEHVLAPFGFYRVSRSKLINLKYISQKFVGEEVMVNNFAIKPSRRRLNDFRKVLASY